MTERSDRTIDIAARTTLVLLKQFIEDSTSFH
jgi:hypothetical protein